MKGDNLREVLTLLGDVGPMSSAELSSLVGRSQISVMDSIRRLRRKGIVYIKVYERQPPGRRGEFIPQYAVGAEPDAKRPVRKTKKQINAAYRARKGKILSMRRGAFKKYGMWKGLL